MKKIAVILILISTMLIVSLPANALIYAEYGGPLLRDSFELDDVLTVYPYTSKLNGTISDTVTAYNTDTVRNGDKSVAIDLSSLAVGESAAFARTVYNKGVDPTLENYGVVFYLKGENLTENDIQFHYYYDGNKCGAYSSLKTERSADGWFRVEAILPRIHDYNLSQSGYVGVLLVKRAGGPNIVYMDDLEVFPVPDKIDFEDRSISNRGRFNLDEIRAIAYSPVGTAEDLPNSKFTSWKVVSENAEIEGRELIYKATAEKIVLKGEFFGCSDEVTLYVSDSIKENPGKAALVSGEISVNEGVYSVTVTNIGTASGNASIIAAVYENGRLCNITVSSAVVFPDASIILSTEKVTGTDVKVSVWDGIFGCINY